MSLPDESAVLDALRAIDDPEAGMNIVDLGLVYAVRIGDGRIDVDMTMTTPACPVAESLVDEARAAVEAIAPAAAVEVHLVWEPIWNPSMMSGTRGSSSAGTGERRSAIDDRDRPGMTGRDKARGPALRRLPLLALGFVALIVGTLAGLARLGWPAGAAASAAALHGPLMICGFFGVVIALERAVAIGRAWTYLGPLFAGVGTLLVLSGSGIGAWLQAAGATVLLAATADVFRRQRALFTFTLLLGALAFVVGCVSWAAGGAVFEVVPWWLAFLVLTIAGERLELSRFRPPSIVATRVFAVILAAIAVALAAGVAAAPWSTRLFAAALLALAAWLLKQDIARRTVRSTGLTRFIAVCLLSGYFWLAVGAAVLLAAGDLQPGAAAYDAALHALLLGFVFSMVFGHAPIIFPAVLRVAVPYSASFYAPLALLHASLVLRLLGDAAGRFDLTRLGGLLGALALAAFIGNTIAAVVRGRRSPR